MNKINHVAIIMDGNGRWGKKKKKSRNFGHLNGIKIIERLVEDSIKIKIPILTLLVILHSGSALRVGGNGRKASAIKLTKLIIPRP